MSLIRQVWLLLTVTLALAIAGALGVSVQSARQYLQTQLVQKNNDAAQSLALSLSQQHGDPVARELAVASQFDTGFYQSIRLVGADGRVLLERAAAARGAAAPDWFVRLVGLAPGDGVAQVSDGWKQIGRIEVRSQVAFAQDELWRSAMRSLGLLAGVAMLAAALAWVGVRRLQGPLERTVEQARAITERRFVTVVEPEVPELRKLTRAMNAMVHQVKGMFDEQAGQVDLLRRQAHCDPLTGLSNRAHLLARVRQMLDSEDGAASGALVLLRLSDLNLLNRRLGRAATDRLLQDVAAVLSEIAARGADAEAGRLNGSDFVLVLPDAGSVREPALELAARLRSLLRPLDGAGFAVVGAVRWWHGAPLSSLLAAADQALARAEGAGPWSVEVDDSGDGQALGEDAWRHRLQTAVAQRTAQLADFPLVGPAGQLLHHESPLRLRLGEDGALVSAVQWLPMARRAGLTAEIDLLAVELALQAIAADRAPRSVNLSPASLGDPGFALRLRGVVAAHPAAAPGLSVELAEAGTVQQLDRVRALADQLHPLGAHVGLEHAGARLGETAGLLEAGLDFVKLDASLVQGLAEDAARAQHVGGLVRMLHGIGLRVYAEGVSRAEDAAQAWACGVDGQTGPAVQVTA